MTKTPHSFMQGPFVRSIMLLTSGAAVGQLVGVLTLPVISRIYSVAEIGVYAVISSVSSILASGASLSLGAAVMAVKTERSADRLSLTAARAGIMVIAAAFLLLLVIAPLLEVVAFGTAYVLGLAAAASTATLALLSGLMYARINRLGEDTLLARVPIINAIATSTVTIPLGLLGAGWAGMLFGALVASGITLALFLRRHNPFLARLSWRASWSHVRRLRGYTVQLTTATVAQSLSLQLPLQLVSRQFGPTGAAPFSMNDRILRLPLIMLVGPISTVFFREASKLHRAHRNLGRPAFMIVCRLLTGALIPVIVLTIWAPDIFAFVLGQEWRTAGQIAAIMAPATALTLCADSVTTAATVMRQQRAELFSTLLRATLVISAFVVAAWLELELLDTVMVLAGAIACAALVHLSLIFTIVCSYRTRTLLFALGFLSVCVASLALN